MSRIGRTTFVSAIEMMFPQNPNSSSARHSGLNIICINYVTFVNIYSQFYWIIPTVWMLGFVVDVPNTVSVPYMQWFMFNNSAVYFQGISRFVRVATVLVEVSMEGGDYKGICCKLEMFGSVGQSGSCRSALLALFGYSRCQGAIARHWL